MEPYERIDRRTIDDKVYETLKDVREDDAVLVRYKPSSFMESSIGFVNKIRKHDLFLCPDRDPRGILFKLSNRILGQSVHYHEIADIRIVDRYKPCKGPQGCLPGWPIIREYEEDGKQYMLGLD
ncbi:MAG: hypothetical protein ACLFSL_02565 [Candidatus Woesearchaeota archaeon]